MAKRDARPPGTPSRPKPPPRQMSVPANRYGPNPPPLPMSKDTAACCVAQRLPDGRPCLGYCGPDCERRTMFLAHLAWLRRSGAVVTRGTINERRAHG